MQRCHEAREAGSIDVDNIVVRGRATRWPKSRKEMGDRPFLAWKRFNTAIESN